MGGAGVLLTVILSGLLSSLAESLAHCSRSFLAGMKPRQGRDSSLWQRLAAENKTSSSWVWVEPGATSSWVTYGLMVMGSIWTAGLV